MTLKHKDGIKKFWTVNPAKFKCTICGHPATTLAGDMTHSSRWRYVSACVHCDKSICYRCYLSLGDKPWLDEILRVHTSGECEAMQWIQK